MNFFYLFPKSFRVRLFMVALFWLIVFLLSREAVRISREASFSAVEAIQRERLAYRLTFFRSLLHPHNLFTELLSKGRRKAEKASSPEDWREILLREFSSFGSGSVELILVGPAHTVPVFPSWRSESLKNFLDILSARPGPKESLDKAVSFTRKFEAELDANPDFLFALKRRVVSLPERPNFRNSPLGVELFSPDKVIWFSQLQRNSWLGWGIVGNSFPDWNYFIVIHRQDIRESQIAIKAVEIAREKGFCVGVDSPSFCFFSSPPPFPVLQGKVKNESPREMDPREKVIFLLEENPVWGRLSTWTSPSNEVSVFSFGNFLWFSLLLVFVMFPSYRLFLNPGFENLKVKEKVIFGFAVGVSFPIVLLLVFFGGVLSMKEFQALLEAKLDMENSYRIILQQFSSFKQKEALRFLKGTEIGNLNRVEIPESLKKWEEEIYRNIQPESVELVSSQGVIIIPRKELINWNLWNALQFPADLRERTIQDLLNSGMSLSPSDLPLLENSRWNKVFQTPKFGGRLLENIGTRAKKLGSFLGRKICEKASIAAGKPPLSSSPVELPLVLELLLLRVFPGGSEELVDKIYNNLNSFQRISLFGERFNFFRVLRDTENRAHYFLQLQFSWRGFFDRFACSWLNHEKACGPLSVVFLSPKPALANSIVKPELDFARGFLEFDLGHAGAFQGIVTDRTGNEHLVGIFSSPEVPEFLIVLSRGLEGILGESPWMKEMGFSIAFAWVFFLLLLMSGFQRSILGPLAILGRGIEAIRRGDYRTVSLGKAVGELEEIDSLLGEICGNLRQLDFAKVIQSHYFPQKPLETENFTIHGKSMMLNQVGGDYFDIVPLKGQRCLLSLGDVSGHGLSAAIVVAMAKSAIAIFSKFERSPDIMISRLNHLILKLLAKSKMMTFFLGILDLQTGKLSFSSAGQAFPPIVRKDGSIELVKLPSFPMGMFATRPYSKSEIIIEPEDTLTLYSDGIYEARSPNGEQYGYDRFFETLVEVRSEDPASIIEKTILKLRDFTGTNPWEDDVTILVVKRKK